jgi:outer membrane protein assembly factor BamB
MSSRGAANGGIRRRFTTGRGVAGWLIAASLAAAMAPVLAHALGMFRGNPQHTGIYDVSGVPVFHALKWRFHTGGEVLSSPVLNDGTLYVGSADHKMYALNAASGALRWEFRTNGRVSSSPAIADGIVYFESYDSYLYAVAADSGRLVWKFKTAGERRFAGTHLHGSEPAAESMPDPFDVFLSSPAVWDGNVYFGSGDRNIYALDAKSGQLKWQFKTGDVVHASPAIADGILYVGSWDSYFYALDAKSGSEKWRFKSGVDPDIHNQVGFQSSAAVVDGTVYVGCRDSKLYALDAMTGAKRWVLDTKGSWIVGSPAVRNSKVYVATSDSGLFFEVDAQTGKPSFSLDFKHWPMFSSPAVAGDWAYIGTHEGKLVAISLKERKVAWIYQTDGSRRNGRSYTKDDGTPNYEAAFTDSFYDDLIIGISRMFSVGPILSSPVVADGEIYFGSSDGSVYALT